MKNLKKELEKLRKAEEEITYSDPVRTATLTKKLVRLKAKISKELP